MSKQRSHVAIGPGSASLILMIVVVSMSILCTLGVLSARGDDRLSRRSLEVAQINYTLYDRSERTLASLADLLSQTGDSSEETLISLLPEGVTLEGDLFSWTEEAEGRRLNCTARFSREGETFYLTWTEHSLWAEGGEENTEWD